MSDLFGNHIVGFSTGWPNYKVKGTHCYNSEEITQVHEHPMTDIKRVHGKPSKQLFP